MQGEWEVKGCQRMQGKTKNVCVIVIESRVMNDEKG